MEMNFQGYLRSEKLKDATIEQHVRQVRYFLCWLADSYLLMADVGQPEVLRYVDSLWGEGRSANQINRALLSLRYWFAYLNKEGTVQGNPASGLKVKGSVRHIPTGLLERNELDQLYDSYLVKDDRTHRNKAILGLLVYQALTLEELEKLRPENLKLREGKIAIPETNNNAGRTLELKPFQILDLQEYIDHKTKDTTKNRTALYG